MDLDHRRNQHGGADGGPQAGRRRTSNRAANVRSDSWLVKQSPPTCWAGPIRTPGFVPPELAINSRLVTAYPDLDSGCDACGVRK